jgi:predicted RNA-binding protein with PIN domain
VRFIVDGYNITKRDPATADLELAAQREALVARLASRGATLLGHGPITIVFDGVSGGGTGERRGSVDVRYSRDESADELIVRLVAGEPRGTTVVTSDRRLGARVEPLGARVLDAEMCFEGRRPARRHRRYPAGSEGLPPGANKVTEELKRLWLDEEE